MSGSQVLLRSEHAPSRMLAPLVLLWPALVAALHVRKPVNRLSQDHGQDLTVGVAMFDRRAALLAAAGCCSLTVLVPGAHAALEPRCAEEQAINGGYLTKCMEDGRRVFEWPSVGSISIEQGVAGFGQTGQVVWNAGANCESDESATFPPEGSERPFVCIDGA